MAWADSRKHLRSGLPRSEARRQQRETGGRHRAEKTAVGQLLVGQIYTALAQDHISFEAEFIAPQSLIGFTMTLLATAVHAFKWSFLGELGSRVVGPIVFIVLARLLLPEDFGVVAAATVAVSFSDVFWQHGLARALIQRQHSDEVADANAIFWTNLALAVLIAGAIWYSAPRVAAFFGDARIADVLRVLCLQLPLAAGSAVMTALMQKRFAFRRLFWVRLVTTGGPGLASIPLALTGWGYWALVGGVLAGQALQLVVLWRLVDWRPRLCFDRQRTRELMAFGKWSMLTGVLGWLYGWLDAIVVGHYFGSHEMGLYRSGNTFVVLVFGLILSPLLPVLYSLFSRAQHDLPRLRSALLTVAHAMALISFPVGIGLFALREDVGLLVFGSQWNGIGAVIGLLGLMHAIGWITGANGELYRAVGKPHIEALALLAMLAVYVPVYLLAVQYGLDSFLWARFALALFALVGHALVCWYVVGIAPDAWLRSGVRALGAALVAAFVTQLIDLQQFGPLTRVLLLGTIGLVAYVGLVAALEHRFVRRLIDILRTRSALVPDAATTAN